VSLSSETNAEIDNVTSKGCTIYQETNKGASTETDDNNSLDPQYIYVERGKLKLVATNGS
jgi:hypothetical protein